MIPATRRAMILRPLAAAVVVNPVMHGRQLLVGTTTSGLGTFSQSSFASSAGDVLALYLVNGKAAGTTTWSGLSGWTQRHASNNSANDLEQQVWTKIAAGDTTDNVSPVADATDGLVAGAVVATGGGVTTFGNSSSDYQPNGSNSPTCGSISLVTQPGILYSFCCIITPSSASATQPGGWTNLALAVQNTAVYIKGARLAYSATGASAAAGWSVSVGGGGSEAVMFNIF